MSTARLDPHDTDINLVMYGLTPRYIEVMRSETLTPQMQRVTFSCTDPEGFHFVPMAPDEHVKLFFPQPGTDEIVMPGIGPDGIRPAIDGPRPIYRDYTVRAFDEHRAEVVVDFVLHTHGVGGSWAATASPGDRLGMLGPRGSHIYPTGYDWYLLAADETALPAIGRWFEELPDGKRIAAFIEVAGPTEEVALAPREGALVHYLHRGDGQAGNSRLLERAIRDFDFPDGEFFAWIAGEANTLKPIRRHLRRELGVPKSRIKVDGYWRNGTVNLDHHDPGDEDE
ncbi:siderophore-interacting protein [Gordonia insulae]|uniref:NADPH-dependent ferric-chelate reductase n=1 Tax=Gordonia insulae TaxID=2420509 RepID=A0A3G8JJC1_9ACTN|nr:siderophore-interacting protein [Gordonia insulae]AZG45038.1 NADPH-dependent ferric-chelate reductase [Gordonia insulae]